MGKDPSDFAPADAPIGAALEFFRSMKASPEDDKLQIHLKSSTCLVIPLLNQGQDLVRYHKVFLPSIENLTHLQTRSCLLHCLVMTARLVTLLPIS